MSLKDETYYGPSDLMCGNAVIVYGRTCVIYDCDEFTKNWYKNNMGLDQHPVKLAKARPNVTYQPLPAYDGYGTPEDSLGSVLSLNPKPPKIDMKKMFKQDMHCLRFEQTSGHQSSLSQWERLCRLSQWTSPRKHS